MNHRRLFVFLVLAFAPALMLANNSWGGYHWARQSNPFTLKTGDNVTSNWDAYLGEAISDWSASSVLNLTAVAGQAKGRNCRPTSGRIEVCNAAYGNNGWLGIAQIWVTGGVHITQGTTKVNDTYFNTSTYNTPAWRRLVMCQEIGHDFGLDHQDENFDNPNLGTCMDYTSDPDGPPSNEHPNSHDYAQLESIYAHLDSFTTVQEIWDEMATSMMLPPVVDEDLSGPGEWGRMVRTGNGGYTSLFERNLGNGDKVLTFVIWADEEPDSRRDGGPKQN